MGKSIHSMCSASEREPSPGTVPVPIQKPERVIADKGYESDPLRGRLARRNSERIAPHRSGRLQPPTQDGRSLRRYRVRIWEFRCDWPFFVPTPPG